MDPFIGEIRAFAFTFAPYGWATCDGQIMNINQSTALFSIIGNVFGGDGKTVLAGKHHVENDCIVAATFCQQ